MKNQHTEETCTKLIQYIADSPDEIMEILAPNGWENSPFTNHTSPKLLEDYERKLAWHNTFGEIFKKFGKASEPPVLSEIEKEFAENASRDNSLDEFLDLLGDCLWCIFSNNHDVYDEKGFVYHLGSFRGSGSFIADFFNEHFTTYKTYDYMDFYCADMRIEKDEASYPLFLYIFEKLKKTNLTWRYSFPRLNIISFDQPEAEVKPEEYNPQKAIEDQLEKDKKQNEIEKLRKELDKSYEEAREEAKYKAPPITVRAYFEVYGVWPEGWVVE